MYIFMTNDFFAIVFIYLCLKILLNRQISDQPFCHACMSFNFCECFFRIPSKVDSSFPRYLLIHPLPSNDLNPKYSLELDTVPFGRCIVGVTRIKFGFLKKMKIKMMVAETIVLFFPVTPKLNVVR